MSHTPSGTSQDPPSGRTHVWVRVARASCRRCAAVLVIVAAAATAGGSGVLVQQKDPPEPFNVPVVPIASRGPQSSITCPAGAINISPGTKIQTVVDSYAGNTTFCLKAGVHAITSPITPKSGNSFVGEYGAILDGTGWTRSVNHEAAFTAHNQDIDDVTIRNLVIRNMPYRGIHAWYWMSDRWTIEYNEITGCRTGVNAPNSSVVRRNWIHDNVGNPSSSNTAERGWGYAAYGASNVLFEENEIGPRNGPEQRVARSTNVTFRNNFVHHNVGSGIYYDGDNVGAVIEGNLVEDNAEMGIFYEISGAGTIRNNTIRRSGSSGIYLATSRDVDVYGNTLADNYRGINLFVYCAVVGPPDFPYPGTIGFDLRNNSIRDNTIRVGPQAGVIASVLRTDGTCTAEQAAVYYNGAKNNVFQGNRYIVPSVNSRWWHWGTWKTWSEWQALNQDVEGAVSQ